MKFIRSYPLFLLLSLFVTNVSLFAQKPTASKQPLRTITGQVMDESAGVPLEFATVTIFTKKDSSIVTGTITDEQGKFSMEVEMGSYYVKVEFISYKSLTISDVPMSKETKTVDLGLINVVADTEQLEEVVVQAEKSTMQMALDKRIFNVGKDLATMGGTAVQILDNVPSVTVDVEGEVSLRGGGVRILVDGKPSALVKDANGLRAIPANLIEKVEVITNPSARYEAEGMTGIINIVLKKNKKKGLNGSFDFNVGFPANYGTAINLNYRKEKLNLFTNIGVNYRESPGIGSNYQERIVNGETRITDLSRDRLRTGLTNYARLGFDYYLSPKDILTGSFQYKIGDDRSFTELVYRDYLNNTDASNLYEITDRTDDEVEDETNEEYVISYRKLFEGKGHELNVDLRYQNNVEVESSDFEEIYFDGNRNPTGRENLLQRSNNAEGENRFLVKIDYVYPFSKEGKFEVGYLGSIRSIGNDYKVEEFQDSRWESLPQFTNDFNYDEGIHGLYTSFGEKINKFSFQFGLRAEYSDIRTELLQTEEVNARDYFNLFPSGFLSYDLPKNNSLQLSYSRRIKRPSFWSLNPFFTFSDSRNLFTGNPNLDPEFTDSYEITHIKYWDKGSLASAVYYRHTEGVIERIFEFDVEAGTTLRLPKNLATENSYGLEFNYSFDPVDWWRLSGDFNFFRSITDGETVNRDGETVSLFADTYTWFTRFTSRTTFWKNTDLQVRVNYRAPRENTQGLTRSITSVDIGISRDILKNKATLTFNISDLFNSRKYRSTLEDPTFFVESLYQRRARAMTLALNYRLNQQKRRGYGKGSRGSYGGGGEEF